MLVSTFVSMHGCNSLSPEGRRGREKTKSENMEALRTKVSTEDEHNTALNIEKLKSALAKTGKTAPGLDGICYSKHGRSGKTANVILIEYGKKEKS